MVEKAGRAARTRASILAATRDLLIGGSTRPPTVGEVASNAGVSRLTVYHHFGSHAGLIAALAAEARSMPRPGEEISGLEQLRATIRRSCEHWARDPALFRRLPAAAEIGAPDHELAQRLAADDGLRPGCSLKEAEDMIAVLTSFAAFDRLHQDGRRSTAAVVEILMRMAGAIAPSGA